MLITIITVTPTAHRFPYTTPFRSARRLDERACVEERSVRRGIAANRVRADQIVRLLIARRVDRRTVVGRHRKRFATKCREHSEEQTSEVQSPTYHVGSLPL